MALKQTYGHLNPKSPRAADWLEVYGGLDVPLESPVPERRAADHDPSDVRLFYRVAVDKLTPEQRERLIAFVMRKNEWPRAVVEDLIDGDHGAPVLAEDVSVSFDARLVM